MQLVSIRISETFDFCHSIEGGFFLRYTNFGPIGSFSSYEKKNALRTMCLHFSKMSNIEHRALIKFFITKFGIMASKLAKSWIMFTRTLLHLLALSPSGWLNSRIQNVASKMHSEWDAHQLSLPMKILKP